MSYQNISSRRGDCTPDPNIFYPAMYTLPPTPPFGPPGSATKQYCLTAAVPTASQLIVCELIDQSTHNVMLLKQGPLRRGLFDARL